MTPGSVARGGYLTSVLGIATSGYLGGIAENIAYPQGAEAEGQAGVVSVQAASAADAVGAAIAGQAGVVTVSAVINIPSVAPEGSDNFLLLLQDGCFVYLEGDSKYRLLLEGGVSGFADNADAFRPSQSGLTICERSGMVAKPGQLVKDPNTGAMVLPRYVDEYQPEPEKMRRRHRHHGPKSPEQDINWITTPITSDDL